MEGTIVFLKVEMDRIGLKFKNSKGIAKTENNAHKQHKTFNRSL